MPAMLAAGAGVYPRTGGGNWVIVPTSLLPSGLSPHGRGKLPAETLQTSAGRSIPARAGETLLLNGVERDLTVYPRTGGGNAAVAAGAAQRGGLSPHGRGKRCDFGRGTVELGSIPARAGETSAGLWGRGRT